MTEEPVPADYVTTLAELREHVTGARMRVQRAANTELIRLYWSIGRTLVERTRSGKWGSGILARLADDLRREFPHMKGLSATNLKYMRQFARAWPDSDEIGQHRVDQLTWGHVTVLIRAEAGAQRWYARRAADEGWTRGGMLLEIKSRTFERQGRAPTNFGRVLDEGADAAQQMTRDPYVLDFLATKGDLKERELERGLVERVVETLRAFGSGFAFVGRQVHFDVDGSDFFVDLLFFHVVELRYVVVELKTDAFKPEYLGQLGFYVALVDDKLRTERHGDTVGLLLVASKSNSVVRYSLGTQNTPLGVASIDSLPAGIRRSLPSEEDMARALGI